MVNAMQCLICGVHLTPERTMCACGTPTTEKPTVGQMTYALEHMMDTGNHVLNTVYANTDATAQMVGVTGIGDGMVDCRILITVEPNSVSIEQFEFPVAYLEMSTKEAVCVAAARDEGKLIGGEDWE